MKQINLRKAAAAVQALQLEVKEKAKQLTASANVQVSVYGDLDTAHASAVAKYEELTDSYLEYTTALYELRSLVSEANIVAGVPTILNRIALTDAKISALTSVANLKTEDIAIAKLRLASLKTKYETTPSSHYDSYTQDCLSVSAVSDSVLEKAKATLLKSKAIKRELQDSLLEANISNKVTLTPSLEKVLGEIGLF